MYLPRLFTNFFQSNNVVENRASLSLSLSLSLPRLANYYTTIERVSFQKSLPIQSRDRFPLHSIANEAEREAWRTQTKKKKEGVERKKGRKKKRNPDAGETGDITSDIIKPVDNGSSKFSARATRAQLLRK